MGVCRNETQVVSLEWLRWQMILSLNFSYNNFMKMQQVAPQHLILVYYCWSLWPIWHHQECPRHSVLTILRKTRRRGNGGNAWSLIKGHVPSDPGWPCMDDRLGQWVFSAVAKRSTSAKPKQIHNLPTICRCECHLSGRVPASSSFVDAFQTEPTKRLGWKNNEMFIFQKSPCL